MAATGKKKGGLSIEEKVAKVEEWFSENPHPYTLKELVVHIPKAKGVIFQSIEECLEVLVSENRVQSDRLGTSVMYWKFAGGASAATAAAASSLTARAERMSEEELLTTIAEYDERSRVCQESITARLALNETPEEKEVTDQALKNISAELLVLKQKLAEYSDRDPVVAEKVQEACSVALAATNRWTENLDLLVRYVATRMSTSSRDVRQRFAIPDDAFEYVALPW